MFANLFSTTQALNFPKKSIKYFNIPLGTVLKQLRFGPRPVLVKPCKKMYMKVRLSHWRKAGLPFYISIISVFLILSQKLSNISTMKFHLTEGMTACIHLLEVRWNNHLVNYFSLMHIMESILVYCF